MKQRTAILLSRCQRLVALTLFMSIVLLVQARRVGVFCYMAAAGTEVFNDGNVCLRLVLTPQGEALLELENLTDSVIDIDRVHSFAYVNGIAAPLYAAASFTEAHTYGRVVAENTADAPIRWLIGKSHTQARTVSEQPVQVVAPHGIVRVYAWPALPPLLRTDIVWPGRPATWYALKCKGRFADSRRSFRKGESRRYDRQHTPLTLAADVQYRFAYGSGSGLRARVSDYVSAIDIGSYRKVGRDGVVRAAAGPACFAFRSGKALGNSVLEWGASVALLAGMTAVVVSMNSVGDGFGNMPSW